MLRRAAFAVLVLAGCGREDPLETAAHPEDTAPADFFQDIAWEQTAVPTVLSLRWSTAEPASSRALFTSPEAAVEGSASSDSTGTEHQVLLLGLPQATSLSVQLEATTATASHQSTAIAAQTGSFPFAIPEPELSRRDVASQGSSFTVITALTPQGSFPGILDAAGRWVWAWPAPSKVARTLISRDRRSILFLGEDETLVRVALDGSWAESQQIPRAHLDFLELPDGTLAMLGRELRSYSYKDFELRYRAETIVELAPDGAQRTVWSAFDAQEPTVNTGTVTGNSAAGSGSIDFTHGNGLAYDSELDVYYVSLQLWESIARVGRSDGATHWLLGGKHSDFAVSDEAPVVGMPHSIDHIAEDRLLIFNRSLDTGGCSQATEVQLDLDRMSAEPSWAGTTESCLQVSFLGDAHRLENGNTLVVWSSAGQLDELTSELESVLRINLPLGYQLGFAQPVESLYAE